MAESDPASQARVRVWDLPTRVFHWLLVALIPFSWWAADSGRMDWHRYSGYTLLGLVTFRIYWGFAGSSTARFRNFVRGPRAIANYLRGRWASEPGHNPVGALSVVLLLALLATQIALGLFAVDLDGIESGPLSIFVSFEAGRVASTWHCRVFDILTIVIALHVLAVGYYTLRKDPMVAAMVHGQRPMAADARPVVAAGATRFIMGVVLAGVIVWLAARW